MWNVIKQYFKYRLTKGVVRKLGMGAVIPMAAMWIYRNMRGRNRPASRNTAPTW